MILPCYDRWFGVTIVTNIRIHLNPERNKKTETANKYCKSCIYYFNKAIKNYLIPKKYKIKCTKLNTDQRWKKKRKQQKMEIKYKQQHQWTKRWNIFAECMCDVKNWTNLKFPHLFWFIKIWCTTFGWCFFFLPDFSTMIHFSLCFSISD